MRRALLLAAALLLLAVPAAAEEEAARIVAGLDLQALEAAAEGTGVDVRTLIAELAAGRTGIEAEALPEQVRALFLQEWQRLLALLPGVILPTLISALAAQLIRRGRAADAAQALCYLACALAEAGILATLMEDAGELVRRAAALAEAIFPLLTGLLAAAGAAATASLLTPLAALIARSGAALFSGAGLRLCGLAAAVAVAGNLNERHPLKNLFSLLRSLVNWTAGLVMTGFVGLLGVQGLLGAGYDSASVRAARYAVDNLLPVIGGEVADTMDAMVTSVLLVKNAAGVAGMVLLFALCAAPLVRAAAALLCLKAAAALMEPVAEARLTRLTEQFAGVVQMLLVLAAGCAALLLVLLGAALAAGRNVVR